MRDIVARAGRSSTLAGCAGAQPALRPTCWSIARIDEPHRVIYMSWRARPARRRSSRMHMPANAQVHIRPRAPRRPCMATSGRARNSTTRTSSWSAHSRWQCSPRDDGYHLERYEHRDRGAQAGFAALLGTSSPSLVTQAPACSCSHRRPAYSATLAASRSTT